MLEGKGPLVVAGIGIAICFANFGYAAAFEKSGTTEVVFYLGFGITTLGVLWGFGRFKQE
jgi:hypothetical protein